MSNQDFVVEDGYTFSKKSDRTPYKSSGNPSAGRQAAAGAFGAYHSAVAGRKGKKLEATGKTLGAGIAGNLVGNAAGAALTRGNPAGAILGGGIGAAGGAIGMSRHNNRKGLYKPEVKDFKKSVKKSQSTSAFGVDHGA